jgi:hypothetical protein
MITLRKPRWIKNIARSAVLVAVSLVVAVPQVALAQAPTNTSTTTNCTDKYKVDYSANDINYYDPCGNNVCNGTTGGSVASSDTITRFLQALADQESSGNPKANNVQGGARGKYQYIDRTWQGSAKTYYPPAYKYDNALDAPEEYQDAVAYLEYTSKFKQYNGDLFKLAISHFFPAALTNPSLLDIVPHPEAGNISTPREYAQAFIQRVNSGAGKNIPIKAAQAPEFATYLAKAGGQASGASGGACATTNGVVGGDIVKTALNLAWPTTGHGKNKSDATPAYQVAMPKYNGATDIDPFSDCGVFVATVMIASGADPNYQKRGTGSQIAYAQSHPDKYTFIQGVTDTSKLQPGDILVNYGHTFLFTGVYKGGDGKIYNSASASLHDHVPQATNWYDNGFFVVRLKK